MRAFASYCCLVGIAAVLGAPDIERRVDCADPSLAQPLYREFNNAAGDHFYTTDEAEYNRSSASNGYFAEGVRAAVFISQWPGTVPLLRLWSGSASDHFYTTNAMEANAAVTQGGFTLENVTPMYVYPTQICGAVPWYRLYAGGTKDDHFYTTSEAERDGTAGYGFESIDGYVLPVSVLTSASGEASASSGGVLPAPTSLLPSTSGSAQPPANSNGVISPQVGYTLFSMTVALAFLVSHEIL
ncbi:hypothetical protein C8R43DRAFT_1064297 [Mycena crocata]|nr:hypothetical protein C8R43DRAFT_1064297 [Mycena crocata]